MGSGRRWRGNYNRINTQLLELEDDHAKLELVYPQANQLVTTVFSRLAMQSYKLQSRQTHGRPGVSAWQCNPASCSPF